jgi:hypothetical protein
MLVRKARRRSERVANGPRDQRRRRLATALGTEDPRQLAKVTAALENLAKRLART